MANLLDEFIETRVKGTTAIKEAINTALVSTGIVTLRGLAFGAVALYERHQKVSKELESGERTEGYFKELVINGFKETISKLALKEGKTKTEKALGFVKAAGTVLRFTGFAHLAEAEISTDGMRGMFDKAIVALQEKGAAQFAVDNVTAQVDRSTELFHKVTLGGYRAESSGLQFVADKADGSLGDVAIPVTRPIEVPLQEAPQNIPTDSVHEKPPINMNLDQPEDIPAVARSTVLENKTLADLQQHPNKIEQVVDRQLELATVRQGDGLIRIAQRQLADDPVKYGYSGDINNEKEVAHWVRKTAFDSVVKAGLANADGWMGLGGKSIGNMAVMIEKSEDGKINFHFADAKTGDDLSPEQIKGEKFVYDHKNPVVTPKEQAIAKALATIEDPYTDNEPSQTRPPQLTQADRDEINNTLNEIGFSTRSSSAEHPIDEVIKSLNNTENLKEPAPIDIATLTKPDIDNTVDNQGVTYYGGPSGHEESTSTTPAGRSWSATPEENDTSKDVTPGETTSKTGEIAFTQEYTPEQQHEIVKYVEGKRLERQEMTKMLENYRDRYGDRQQFTRFEAGVREAFIENLRGEQHLLDQVSGKIDGKVEVHSTSTMTPHAEAKAMVEAKIRILEERTGLTTVRERADNAFAHLDHGRGADSKIPTFESSAGKVTFDYDENGNVKDVSGNVRLDEKQLAAIEKTVGVTRGDINTATTEKGAEEKFKLFLAQEKIMNEMKAAGSGNTKEYRYLREENSNYLKKLVKEFPALKDKLTIKLR